MNLEPLRQAGLSEGEIKVYLSILRLGLTTAGPIIKETKLQSSSTYHILDSLIEKGIISFNKKNKRKYFYAVSADRLLDFINEKKKALEKEEHQIQKLLPELNLLKAMSTKTSQEMLIFEGWDGVLSAFKEAYKQLKPGTTCYVFTMTKELEGGADPKQTRWLVTKVREFREQINKKIKNKIKMKIIAEKGSEIGMDQAKTSHTEVKFIDVNYSNFAVFNIYGEVTLIGLWLKKPIAFFINSKEVAESFKHNFDLIWKNANK